MASSTTSRLAARPMQMAHWLAVSPPVPKIRWRMSMVVMATMASRETPYLRS